MKKTQTNAKWVIPTVIAIILIVVGFFAGWVLRPVALGNCTSLSLAQGSASGAAGTIYKNAVITNTSTSSCAITGYPAVFMQDGSGVQLGSGAHANSLYAPAAITLAPGGKAHTVVAYPQQPNFPAGTCTAIGSSMKMYVPGLTTALVTPWSDYNCPGFSATALQPGAE